MPLLRDIRSVFEFFLSLGSRPKIKGMFIMIWHAGVWTIWSVRNYKFFSGSSTNMKEVEDNSIYLAWSWFSNRSPLNSLSFID